MRVASAWHVVQEPAFGCFAIEGRAAKSARVCAEETGAGA
jgi:hypothetical protein